MDYSKFKQLIGAGEKETVDFKIECSAFASNALAPKAELAKDIIAMCNNGTKKSYILIGVSDDRGKFKSVANKKLTDDNLQSFCKSTIAPPPKVSLRRVTWKKALGSHKGIEFVIIEIGPNRCTAYSFAREMIDYSAKVCFKRHEVWIRRGSTSDLATPEEVSRLVQGRPAHQDVDEETLAGRKTFDATSEQDQRVMVDAATKKALLGQGYRLLLDNEAGSLMSSPLEAWPIHYKQIGGIACFVVRALCIPTLTQRELRRNEMWGVFWPGLADWAKLPPCVTQLKRRMVKGVRRLLLIPVLRNVPASRIGGTLTKARKLGNGLHYYWPGLRNDGKAPIKSSSEILVMDGIKSIPDYARSLDEALAAAEAAEEPFVMPPTKLPPGIK
jgi:hypothetical protein